MTRLIMTSELAGQIKLHSSNSYPNECCGALLGAELASEREVLQVMQLANERHDSPHNRFSITPKDVMEVQKKADTAGLEVIGWYHSHPDHPAEPSEYDREHAWPNYSYIIVSVNNQIPQQMTSWRLTEDRGKFEQEEVDFERKHYRTSIGT
jgi:proteasome lid subunit RPN8/RPN11